MAFNPDDPHDGQATDGFGFTYRMIHIGPELVSAACWPTRPAARSACRCSPTRWSATRCWPPGCADLHGALLGDATALRRDELLAGVVLAAARLSRGTAARTAAALAELPAGAGPSGQVSARPGRADAAADARRVARRARDLIAGRYLDDLTAADLAAATGRSRFAVHRAFTHVYGMPPERLPAPAAAARGPRADRGGNADQRGRGPGRVRRPEPPVALVRPLLRRHPRPLPAGHRPRPIACTGQYRVHLAANSIGKYTQSRIKRPEIPLGLTDSLPGNMSDGLPKQAARRKRLRIPNDYGCGGSVRGWGYHFPGILAGIYVRRYYGYGRHGVDEEITPRGPV